MWSGYQVHASISLVRIKCRGQMSARLGCVVAKYDLVVFANMVFSGTCGFRMSTYSSPLAFHANFRSNTSVCAPIQAKNPIPNRKRKPDFEHSGSMQELLSLSRENTFPPKKHRNGHRLCLFGIHVPVRSKLPLARTVLLCVLTYDT